MSNSLQIYRTILPEIEQTLAHLSEKLQQTLVWMMVGMYLEGQVHLAKIGSHRVGQAKLESKERQNRRFVAHEGVEVEPCYAPYAQSVLEAAAAGGRLRLLIDTLELSGQRQILTVAVAYRRRSLPLIWQVQRRKGLTDAETQTAFLARLLPWLPSEAEVVLIGDGEFHSVDLMAWCQDHGWHFRLRLHADTYIQLADGTWVQLQELALAPGERRYLQDVHVTKDKGYGPLNLALTWPQEEEHAWFIATDQPAAYATLRDDTRRMWIEEMFGDWQGNGFHLHLSRLFTPHRLSRLLLVLCLVYTWLLHIGAWVIKRGLRSRIDRNDRRDRSLFQLGRLWIRDCLTNANPLRIGFHPYPS